MVICRSVKIEFNDVIFRFRADSTNTIRDLLDILTGVYNIDLCKMRFMDQTGTILDNATKINAIPPDYGTDNIGKVILYL